MLCSAQEDKEVVDLIGASDLKVNSNPGEEGNQGDEDRDDAD